MIGNWRGTRNVLGLLLMTFGLEAAVSREPRIEVIDGRSATRRQRDMIAHEAIILADERR